MPPDAWEPDEDHLRELEEVPVRLTPFLTTREDTYDNPLAAALLSGGTPTYDDEEDEQAPQLLGRTTNVQGEDPAPMGRWVRAKNTEEEDWCLLLHLTPSLGMDLGDGGDLSILIRYDDLAAGRYDRLATDISMN